MALDNAEKLLAALNETHIPAVAAPDGTDAGTTQTVANATKATLNTLIAELQAAGILAAS